MVLEIKYFNSGKIPEDIVESLLKSAENDNVPFIVRDNPMWDNRTNLEFVLKYHKANGQNYIAFLDGKAIGCVNFYVAENSLGEKIGDMSFLYTKSEYRDLKIGSLLFLYALRKMRFDGANSLKMELAKASDVPIRNIIEKVLKTKLSSGIHKCRWDTIDCTIYG